MGGIGCQRQYVRVDDQRRGGEQRRNGRRARDRAGRGQTSPHGINASTIANRRRRSERRRDRLRSWPPRVGELLLDENESSTTGAGGSGGGAHVVTSSNSLLCVDHEHLRGELGGARHRGYAPGRRSLRRRPVRDTRQFRGPSRLTQHDNVFTGNSVKSFPNGAGLRWRRPCHRRRRSSTSRASSTAGCSNTGQPGSRLGVRERGRRLHLLRARVGPGYGFLDAVAGNSVGAFGEGGGWYIGAATDAQSDARRDDGRENSVGAGGLFAGLSGAGTDELIMRNSIVFNGAGDIDGYDSYDVKYSDACQAARPSPGAGQHLRGPEAGGRADVHQTKASPTMTRAATSCSSRRAGSGPNTDYEGDPRPTDGDGDGHTVDMGADETPAGFAAAAASPASSSTPAAVLGPGRQRRRRRDRPRGPRLPRRGRLTTTRATRPSATSCCAASGRSAWCAPTCAAAE